MLFFLLALLISVFGNDYIVVLKERHKHQLHGFVSEIKEIESSNIKNVWNMRSLTAFHGDFDSKTLLALSQDSRVEYIEKNQPLKLVSSTNFTNTSPYYNWALSRLSFSPLQTPPSDRTYAIPGSGQGNNTHIYVIDTGIRYDYNNTEFSGRIGNGQTCIQSLACTNALPTDDNGHGTSVASLAAGATVGVAQRAIIHPVKAFLNGVGTTVDVINAINWIINEVETKRL